MVAVWKSDLVGSDQLGGGLTLTGQMPSDDPKSGFADQGGKFPDRPPIQFPVTSQKILCSNAWRISA
jgi:hypothetical protein